MPHLVEKRANRSSGWGSLGIRAFVPLSALAAVLQRSSRRIVGGADERGGHAEPRRFPRRLRLTPIGRKPCGAGPETRQPRWGRKKALRVWRSITRRGIAFRPYGAYGIRFGFPALTRWATFWRPYGADAMP